MFDKMKFTEETIIRYLEGELSQQEAYSFAEELKINESFADLYERHAGIHKTLSTNKPSSPPPDFTSKVMLSIASLDIRESKFFNKTRLYVILLIVIAVATTLYYISSQFYPAIGGAIANEIKLKEFTLNLQPAQKLLSSDLLFKIVFYVNGLICLLLLDRAVLKPYFARRRERYAM